MIHGEAVKIRPLQDVTSTEGAATKGGDGITRVKTAENNNRPN